MKVAGETELAVREFGLGAASHLTKVLPENDTDYSVGERWELEADGRFRQRPGQTPNLWVVFGNEWLNSLPGYDSCVAKLRSDPCLGRHLDHFVGTYPIVLLLKPENIMSSLIYSMFDAEGSLTSADEKLAEWWQKLVNFAEAEWLSLTTIAPIPHLTLPEFPLRLNDDIVLDRLTECEVTRCCEYRVLQHQSATFPLIEASFAVGLRRTVQVRKIIRTREDSGKRNQPTPDEGRFGHRPVSGEALVVDDLLSAMRLFKRTQVRAAGHATWTESPWGTATSFLTQGRWPFFGGYDLTKEEIPRFLELWHLLEDGAANLGFSIHRFNLAFDRSLLADRIVDLVIAAESLFLGELDVPDRGELRFRFALRAGKFIEHPDYTEHDIYRVMRRAYDARSAIVHGGSPEDTRLPDNQDATLPAFIDVIEELVRLGLRKALSMQKEAARLRQADYWDGLVFPDPPTS